jgi:hypothetical protein
MGVSVKKNSVPSAVSMAPPPAYEYNMAVDGPHALSTSLDKSKKRKR